MTQYAGDVTPKECWEELSADPSAILVDVRTNAEWTYVGVPDLSTLDKELKLIPWQMFPTGEINPNFTQTVVATAGGLDTPIYFMCRSGQRSMAAAIAMTELGYKRCYNVSEGFEGGIDAAGHRGTATGWKFDRLPWKQN